MKVFFSLIIFLFISTALFSQNKIYTIDGKVIDCNTIQKKRFGFEYLPSDGSTTYPEYIPNTKIDRIEYANGDVDYVSGSSNKRGNGKTKKSPTDFTYLSPHYVAINVGPSIPFGYFGYGTGSNGNAYTGVNVNFDATAYIFRGYGVGITGGYSYNPFNGMNHPANNSSYYPTGSTGINITTLGGWNNAYIMGGAGYFSEISRMMFDYKVMIGGIFSYFPTATTTYTDSSGLAQTSTFTADAQGLMYGAQGSVRYYLTRKFQLKGTLSLMYGYVSFSQLTRKDYQSGLQVGFPISGNYSITSFNITVGVAYTIGK